MVRLSCRATSAIAGITRLRKETCEVRMNLALEVQQECAREQPAQVPAHRVGNGVVEAVVQDYQLWRALHTANLTWSTQETRPGPMREYSMTAMLLPIPSLAYSSTVL